MANEGIDEGTEFGPATWTESFDNKAASLRALIIEKQSAYGHDNINQGGVSGLRTRIGDKIARIDKAMEHDRLRSLVLELHEHFPAHFGARAMSSCLSAIPTIEDTDESFEDTLMDLGNYASIWLMVRADEWNLDFNPNE
jgi:hypothetical protein